MLAWVLCGVLFTAVVVLTIKNILIKRNLAAISRDFAEHLSDDTNTPVTVSSGDRHIRRFTQGINRELTRLRKEQRRYAMGNRELKDAVASVSHDLRTPLTAICGYLDLLENEEKSDEAVRYLSIIRERTEVMKELMEELLRYSVVTSAYEEPSMENTNICAVLEESLFAYYGALTARGITPTVAMPDEAVYRMIDRVAMMRVFGNIIGNALKYSDGDLTVTADADGNITFSNDASKLDSVQVEQLFERFYTVNTAKNSTGLGLYISKLLIEQMGYTITARYNGGRLYIDVCLNKPQ